MRHFKHIVEKELSDKMLILPSQFDKCSPKPYLSKALGAALYMPANKKGFMNDIINSKYPELTTMVLDLEDAIEDGKVEEGENEIFKQLEELEFSISEKRIEIEHIPILFIRIRNPEHLNSLLSHYKKMERITGFILPKFSSVNAVDYLNPIQQVNDLYNMKFYGMPILESKSIIYKETRVEELFSLKKIIDSYQDIVLNVRIGGTDFSGLYALRRTVDTTIYDVSVVKDCIADILNIFNRAEDDYVVSGVVWEFFESKSRMLKPQLRETPFIEEKGLKGLNERKKILNAQTDGLIKEVILDKTNGIIGKTIIHPSHISIVNALQTVTEEEYLDAISILDKESGVSKSLNGNKMNEMKPHSSWAKKIIEQSKIYGVLKKEYNYNVLF